ncbi:MAG: RecQ family DEAD/DEAH box helicase, partial [Bdellovibrionota bacterium]
MKNGGKLSQAIDSFLSQNFPYSEFRPLQKAVIERCHAGQNTLAIMPTGGGKSLIYQFLAREARGSSLVVVLSPLIALMQDQYDRARKLGIEVTFLASTVPAEEREKRLSRLEAGSFELLFVTPERFKNERFRQVIVKRKVSLLVVDEAHCISLWSHDFRPEYGKIPSMRVLIGNPPVLALTATATKEVQADILAKLGLFSEGVVGTPSRSSGGSTIIRRRTTVTGDGSATATATGTGLKTGSVTADGSVSVSDPVSSPVPVAVAVAVTDPSSVAVAVADTVAVPSPVVQKEKAEVLIGTIERKELVSQVKEVYGFEEKVNAIKENLEEGKPTLIYFLLIDTLEKVAREIRKLKIPYRTYHGDLMPSQRKRNQRDFIEGRDWLMLATPAFGLGVD